MTPKDLNNALAWRNLVADWHLDQGMPDCGCDDDTPDAEFCPDSMAWADTQFAARDDTSLDGPPDKWSYDIWTAVWGRNVPMVAGALDFRLPKAPSGMSWLVTRLLVRGQACVDLTLLRLGEDGVSRITTARALAEPTTIQARARAILQNVTP